MTEQKQLISKLKKKVKSYKEKIKKHIGEATTSDNFVIDNNNKNNPKSVNRTYKSFK